jgi:hypothetical protein
MLDFAIALTVTFAAGFVLGYGVREWISRRRRPTARQSVVGRPVGEILRRKPIEEFQRMHSSHSVRSPPRHRSNFLSAKREQKLATG